MWVELVGGPRDGEMVDIARTERLHIPIVPRTELLTLPLDPDLIDTTALRYHRYEWDHKRGGRRFTYRGEFNG